MSKVVVGVILILDIVLKGGIGKAAGNGAGLHDSGVDATGLLPINEVSHGIHEVVVADDE